MADVRKEQERDDEDDEHAQRADEGEVCLGAGRPGIAAGGWLLLHSLRTAL